MFLRSLLEPSSSEGFSFFFPVLLRRMSLYNERIYRTKSLLFQQIPCHCLSSTCAVVMKAIRMAELFRKAIFSF